MDIFKNRNFVRLFFAALASQMGTTVGNMAFAFSCWTASAASLHIRPWRS